MTPPSRGPVRPNLFIVGAPKCGTTAWVEYLRTHPDTFFPEIKEPHYFASDLPKMRWSASPGDYKRLFDGAGSARIVGEASVMYLYSTTAAQEIRDFNPEAKILIFLRQQQHFLPSLHHQFLYRFTESIKDFEIAWRLSGKRPPESIPDVCRHPKLLDYKAMGRFSEQVARYLKLFPRQQVHLVWFDEWTANPRATYVEILRVLGITDDGRLDFPRINEAKSHRSKWAGRLIQHPPRFAQAAVRLVKKVTGRRSLGIANLAGSLIKVSGYRTNVSDDLRREIKAHYQEDNRRLEQQLSESSKS